MACPVLDSKRRLLAAVLAVLFGFAFQTAQAAAGLHAEDRAALAASQGGPLFKGHVASVAFTADRGSSWKALTLPAANGNARISAIATRAAEHDVLYVAGIGVGIVRTLDGGDTWISVGDGLPSAEVTAFAPHATQAGTAYAVLAGDSIYRTQDGGKSWRWMHKEPAPINALVHTDMAGSMETGWLFMATAEGVYRTMDCFCFFELVAEWPAGASAIAFDRDKPSHVYAATGPEVFRTTDGGRAWASIGSFDEQVVGLAHADGTVYGLLADGRLMRSALGENDWE
jgi:hypothetical protein